MKKQRTFILNKLVRDKVVDYTVGFGGSVEYKELKGKKLNDALVRKLAEEVKELREAELSVDELADLKEIIEQIGANLKISDKELVAAQKKKNQENGAFKRGLYIEQLSLPADNKWAKYYALDPKRFPEVK